MKRGIRFEIPNEYGSFLGEMLKPMKITSFHWYVGSEEAYLVNENEIGESLFPDEIHGLDGLLLKELIEKDTFVIFANLKAFPKDKNVVDVHTYEEFMNSHCELVCLVTDCVYVDIYCKDKALLETLFENATRNRFENIHYLTNENDDRIRLSVW
ncbi:DUF2691 family protein [Paenibacillus aurantius]|uniref:DUF2691 family protein n=1 Tax=Paenibacillus aurantius TaxID=2918900 RepID=A0AA96RH24_9BACL|nr:DUF2691 family protein [Paenibacillus aurantius]WNQ10679.1 DUF2691 family protein [Paenibacillus aurantius]